MKKNIIIFLISFSTFALIGQEKMKIEYLFSMSGDTMLVFGGGGNDSLNFRIIKKGGSSSETIERFKIQSAKMEITVKDYPEEILKKYNLNFSSDELNSDSIPEIVVIRDVLKQKTKYYTNEFGNLLVYKNKFIVSIKFCNNIILENYKYKNESEALKNGELSGVKKSDYISGVVKMRGKNIYYYYLIFNKTKFMNRNNAKHIHTKYSGGHIIHCP